MVRRLRGRPQRLARQRDRRLVLHLDADEWVVEPSRARCGPSSPAARRSLLHARAGHEPAYPADSADPSTEPIASTATGRTSPGLGRSTRTWFGSAPAARSSRAAAARSRSSTTATPTRRPSARGAQPTQHPHPPARRPREPGRSRPLLLPLDRDEHGRQTRAGLRWAREGIKRFGDKVRPDFAGALYCQAIRSAGALGKPRLAIKIGLEGARQYAYSELCYLLAAQYQAVREFASAEKYYGMAQLLRTRFAEYQMEVGCGSWKAQLGLAGVAWEQGNVELALERAARALEWAPDEPLVRFLYGKTLLAAGARRRPSASARRGRAGADPARGRAAAQPGLLILERAQDAYDLLDGRTRAQPEVLDYWVWLGDFLYELSEYQACATALGAAIERHQESAAVYLRLGQALNKLRRNQDALNAFALASALDPESAARPGRPERGRARGRVGARAHAAGPRPTDRARRLARPTGARGRARSDQPFGTFQPACWKRVWTGAGSS